MNFCKTMNDDHIDGRLIEISRNVTKTNKTVKVIDFYK